jgi:hypothetical protein
MAAHWLLCCQSIVPSTRGSFVFKSVAALLSVGAVLAAGATTAATARTPTAHAASGCLSGGASHWHGYLYIYPISVTHTSCATGKNVAAHHGHVRGWHCSQKTLANSSTERIAQESCKSGRKKVSYKFTQSK